MVMTRDSKLEVWRGRPGTALRDEGHEARLGSNRPEYHVPTSFLSSDMMGKLTARGESILGVFVGVFLPERKKLWGGLSEVMKTDWSPNGAPLFRCPGFAWRGKSVTSRSCYL